MSIAQFKEAQLFIQTGGKMAGGDKKDVTGELIIGQIAAILITAFVIYIYPKINMQYLSQHLVLIATIAATAYFGFLKPAFSDTIFITFLVSAASIFFCDFASQYTGAEPIWEVRDFIILSIFLLSITAFAITSYTRANNRNIPMLTTTFFCFLLFWIICIVIVKPNGIYDLFKGLFQE
jgi:hypothetical protein